MTTACPHCAAANDPASAFCIACGKALPAAAASGPRVVSDKEFASSAAGRSLQADELHKQARSAGRIMMWIGIIQLVLGGLVAAAAGAVASAAPDQQIDPNTLTFMGVGLGIVGAIFIGLSFWARRNPLPAAITGLVLYVTLSAGDVILTLGSDQPQSATRGIFIKIIIVAFLAKAVAAGVKHRALLKAAAA